MRKINNPFIKGVLCTTRLREYTNHGGTKVSAQQFKYGWNPPGEDMYTVTVSETPLSIVAKISQRGKLLYKGQHNAGYHTVRQAMQFAVCQYFGIEILTIKSGKEVRLVL